MNANASDVERRWGRPLMSSFHAAFSLGGAAGAVLGGWLGERGTALGLLGPALLSSLLVAVAAPFLMREGQRFPRRVGFAAPSRRLLPLAALAFVLMATEGSVGDWSGTYLARSGVEPGATAAAYAAFSLLMITGRIVGDGIVGAAGPRATVGLGALLAGAGLAISAAWPGLAGGIIGFGLVGAGLANVVPVLFSVAGRIGSSPAVGVASAATSGYAGLLIGPVVIGAVASGVWSALDDCFARGRCAHCGHVRFVKSGRPCGRSVKARGSKRHRHEETIDARLAAAPPAVYARRSIFIPIENPIITVLAREREGDGDRAKIPVDAIVVAVPVNLVGRQMMRVRWTAARSFHPIRDRGAVCPLVVSACRESGQRSEDRNQTPHAASLAMP